jgi:hypothetical protein
LTSSPFDLSLGEAITVKVFATNSYGDSPYSTLGAGAVIVLVPDAPSSVLDDTAITLED